MINLFENYDYNSRDLKKSLQLAGLFHETIVIEDDGYLPNDIISPVNFFLSIDKEKERVKKESPLFFNEVPIPDSWEISGNDSTAEIFDGIKKRGEIHYQKDPKYYRCVSNVSWLNEEGRVRTIDLYNKYGEFFGKKTYSDGELAATTYFDIFHREVLLIDHTLNSVQLYYKSKYFIFKSKEEFIVFFLQQAKINFTKILYNSLGLPFLLTLQLKKVLPYVDFSHILFWQETQRKIPYNMQVLLDENELSPTKTILIQDVNEYNVIKSTMERESKVAIIQLGMTYEYNISRETVNPSVMTLTNSDDLEGLTDIVEALPDVTINIAAKTNMSSKLESFSKYSNIHLYPNIDESSIESLLKSCPIYLDINRGGEVDNIIRRSFESNQLIIAFEETTHNVMFSSPSTIFSIEKKQDLINIINTAVNNQQNFKELLSKQKNAANQTPSKKYKEIFNG